jgi:putative hydrolase of the HAD superfamily
LHDVLERLGLVALVDGIVTSAELGARKPAAEIFAHALALAGACAHRAVHVGDSLEEDVGGARAAGITPILLVRGGPAAPPGRASAEDIAARGGEVRVIHSLRELDREP